MNGKLALIVPEAIQLTSHRPKIAITVKDAEVVFKSDLP
jgi:hypothetical protein